MIYKANGDIYSTSVAEIATRNLLRAAAGRLTLEALKPTKLEEIFRINDLRRSCGVEPVGGETIRFRRYPSLVDKLKEGKS